MSRFPESALPSVVPSVTEMPVKPRVTLKDPMLPKMSLTYPHSDFVHRRRAADLMALANFYRVDFRPFGDGRASI